MNTLDVETRLQRAATVATPPRSIVDDVMRRLPPSEPKRAPRARWRHPILAVGMAALTGVAATIVFIVLLTGASPHLALADVQAAVERQLWAHVRYDTGQLADLWINLQTGETYCQRTDGDVVYGNERTNTRLWYSKDSGVINQDTPTIYAPGHSPPPWTAKSAWDRFVAPLANAAAATQPATVQKPSVVTTRDALDGIPVIRFDEYYLDQVGKRFLYAQLWADPETHLPVRVKSRLQLGERERYGKEWSTGDYRFGRTGPADLFELGVPRGTPIHKQVAAAPEDVRPIIDAINRNHDQFLKNYRAIVIGMRDPQGKPDGFNIIWRDGDKVREDVHCPSYESQTKLAADDPAPTAALADVLAWATRHEAFEQQLMDSQHEYSRQSAWLAKKPKARVHVTRHDRFPMLATNSWPETMQWPTRYWGPDFHLLGANEETPAGCIGLRWGTESNDRTDYYLDPQNDYVCVKKIAWARRGTEWAKTQEYTLTGLHRVAGRVVAGRQEMHDYGDPVRNLAAYTETHTIDVVPMNAADYPAGIFDPASLTDGADVIGY